MTERTTGCPSAAEVHGFPFISLELYPRGKAVSAIDVYRDDMEKGWAHEPDSDLDSGSDSENEDYVEAEIIDLNKTRENEQK